MFIIRVLISIFDHLESRMNSKLKNANLIFGEDYVEETKARAIDSELDIDIYIVNISRFSSKRINMYRYHIINIYRQIAFSSSTLKYRQRYLSIVQEHP